MKLIPDISFTKLYGDISRTDAIEIAEISRKSKNILEFGIGGSSYIIHQNSYPESTIHHIETVKSWNEFIISKLQDIVQEYDPPTNYCFHYIDLGDIDKLSPTEAAKLSFDPYGFNFIRELSVNILTIKYDFIFVDGLAPLRYSFAHQLWSYLNIGGVMMFHDGKTPWMLNIISEMVKNYGLEIESIEFNHNNSNMIKIVKGHKKEYYNWNDLEKDNNREDLWSQYEKQLKQ